MEPDTVWVSLCLQKHTGFISPHHITQQLEIPFPRGKRAVREADFQGQICKACLDTSGSSQAWWCTPQTPGSHSQALTCSTHFTDRELTPESTLASPLSSPIQPEASHSQDIWWLSCPRCCHIPKPLACQRSFQIPSSSIFHKQVKFCIQPYNKTMNLPSPNHLSSCYMGRSHHIMAWNRASPNLT